MSAAAYFSHPDARCESASVGRGTRIWAFAHVLPGAVIGEDCNICDHVFIENKVHVGHRVTVKCGVQLWDGMHVEDDVFIGPNATFTNDPFPPNRGRVGPFVPLQTRLRHHATIGANATVLPGLTIGAHAIVAAGAVVTRSVPDHALVAGNPARIVRYLDGGGQPRAAGPAGAPGWSLVAHGCVKDAAVDLGLLDQLPFRAAALRLYTGEAAATVTLAAQPHCFVLLLRGACTVTQEQRRLRLDDPRMGLHVAGGAALTFDFDDSGSAVVVLSA